MPSLYYGAALAEDEACELMHRFAAGELDPHVRDAAAARRVVVAAEPAPRFGRWKAATIAASLVLLVGWAAFYFYFQQVFVKRFGGVMSIRVPEGQRHIAATWKADNLWIENYDPRTNECIFYEYSKGSVLEGRVTIKNCNPLAVQGRLPAPAPATEPVPEPAGRDENP